MGLPPISTHPNPKFLFYSSAISWYSISDALPRLLIEPGCNSGLFPSVVAYDVDGMQGFLLLASDFFNLGTIYAGTYAVQKRHKIPPQNYLFGFKRLIGHVYVTICFTCL